MGRPNPVLTIWVAPAWLNHPAIIALRTQGHHVYWMDHDADGVTWSTVPPDLILHPAAHWWSEDMFTEETRKDGSTYQPYLDAALVAARKRRKVKTS